MDINDDERQQRCRELFQELVDLDEKYKRDTDAVKNRIRAVTPLYRLVCYVLNPQYDTENKYHVIGVFASKLRAETFGMWLCDGIMHIKQPGDPQILLCVQFHELVFTDNKWMSGLLDVTLEWALSVCNMAVSEYAERTGWKRINETQ